MEWISDIWASVSVQSGYILRIVIAAICGGVIGIERTLRQKDAGFRTHVIVAIGSSLMMVISKYGFFDLAGTSVSADATRIASNIITGISFLGAGMIFVKGANIKGLTTAAGIWSTAAVSMAIGAGLYFTGIVATFIIVVIQILFHTFLIGFDKVLSTDKTTEIIIRFKNSTELVNEIKTVLSDNGFVIKDGKAQIEIDGTLTLILSVRGEKSASIDEAMMLINKEDVKYVSFN